MRTQKQMVKTTFTTEPCYNPFIFNGVSVHNFNFYKDGHVLASFKWLGSNNIYESMQFEFEIKKAVKINLNRQDAFYISKRDSFNDRTFEIYIPADFVNLQFVERKTVNACWYFIRHFDVYTLTITGEKRVPKLDANKKLYYAIEEGTYTEQFETNTVCEDTQEWKDCNELAEKMNQAAHGNFNAYTVHDLLEKFNITEK